MYRFDPASADIAETLRKIALSQVEVARAAAMHDAPLRRTALLEARRRTKKLRGLLRLVRRAFGPFALENAALRDAAAPLSDLRDNEVLIETVEALNVALPDPALQRIAATLRADDRPAAEIDARLAAFAAQMADVAARVPFWQLEPDRQAVLFDGLKDGYRACRRAMRTAEATPDDDHLHAWRKALKTHAFHLMLLRRAAPEAMDARHGVIDRLGDLLGLHHDLINLVLVARATAERFGAAEDVARMTALAAVRLKELEGAAFALGRQALAEKPGAFSRRIRTYWESIKPKSANAPTPM